jgi:hypothetical protein
MIEIPLTQGQMALIDDEDWNLVSRYKWFAHWDIKGKCFYAVTNIVMQDGKRGRLYMHRIITNANIGEDVDHIHHMTLDNRRSELRVCTHSQNKCNGGPYINNASGYRGVCWHKSTKKWQAQITTNHKRIHLGYFLTAENAHEAYKAASFKYHGEFSHFQ